MPLFEYRCMDCNRTFESFVTSQRTPECPGCHGANLAKLLSSPGVVGQSTGRLQAAPQPPAGCGMGTCGCKANV